MTADTLTEEAARARVFAKCEFDTNGGCWLWTGGVKREGYGLISVFYKGRHTMQGAHRVAYGLAKAEGLEVLHKCDIPYCCNPAHLVAGTHAENMADMASKGRAVKASRPYKYLSADEKSRVLALHEQGQSMRKIAQITGRDRASVRLAIRQGQAR